MDSAPRHQCLIYDGPPSRYLSALAVIIREKLSQNLRVLYLNSQPMVAGMRSYLAAAGVDVVGEAAKGSLVLSSDRDHLVDGCHFDLERMVQGLRDALAKALSDGFEGLWATGDMTWEVGPDKDFSKLLEYEWRLEEFLQQNPAMGGICQYHTDSMPPSVVRQGLVAHPTIFVNQTLSMLNPVFRYPELLGAAPVPELDSFINRLLQPSHASVPALSIKQA